MDIKGMQKTTLSLI